MLEKMKKSIEEVKQLYYEVKNNECYFYLEPNKNNILAIGNSIIEGEHYASIIDKAGSRYTIYYSNVPILLLLRGYVYFDTSIQNFRSTNRFTDVLLDEILIKIASE